MRKTASNPGIDQYHSEEAVARNVGKRVRIKVPDEVRFQWLEIFKDDQNNQSMGIEMMDMFDEGVYHTNTESGDDNPAIQVATELGSDIEIESIEAIDISKKPMYEKNREEELHTNDQKKTVDGVIERKSSLKKMSSRPDETDIMYLSSYSGGGYELATGSKDLLLGFYEELKNIQKKMDLVNEKEARMPLKRHSDELAYTLPKLDSGKLLSESMKLDVDVGVNVDFNFEEKYSRDIEQVNNEEVPGSDRVALERISSEDILNVKLRGVDDVYDKKTKHCSLTIDLESAADWMDGKNSHMNGLVQNSMGYKNKNSVHGTTGHLKKHEADRVSLISDMLISGSCKVDKYIKSIKPSNFTVEPFNDLKVDTSTHIGRNGTSVENPGKYPLFEDLGNEISNPLAYQSVPTFVAYQKNPTDDDPIYNQHPSSVGQQARATGLRRANTSIANVNDIDSSNSWLHLKTPKVFQRLWSKRAKSVGHELSAETDPYVLLNVQDCGVPNSSNPETVHSLGKSHNSIRGLSSLFGRSRSVSSVNRTSASKSMSNELSTFKNNENGENERHPENNDYHEVEKKIRHKGNFDQLFPDTINVMGKDSNTHNTCNSENTGNNQQSDGGTLKKKSVARRLSLFGSKHKDSKGDTLKEFNATNTMSSSSIPGFHAEDKGVKRSSSISSMTWNYLKHIGKERKGSRIFVNSKSE
ncbi:hypothetical protein AX774_g468 [Zancudomyces culisetae]|uniref:Uncharacterized protein n=1 Tax=Zancudomyces culisetae TaxID=1213189 RepID=A0A1R1PYG1_ZANCU|nr:hypothetical protein AX774_g468 [Zancudomyces culisetae]|eukprot:OMH85959.1 hypothetical protein AX774_g468 [Zancudomyces culisetae]